MLYRELQTTPDFCIIDILDLYKIEVVNEQGMNIMDYNQSGLSLSELTKMSWENPVNFDRLQIPVTIFAIGYIHSNKVLWNSCWIRFFLALLSVSFILIILNYLFVQKELDDKIRRIRNKQNVIEKSWLHILGLRAWWISGVLFTVGFSGILIITLFS